jgi:hypothetical protein
MGNSLSVRAQKDQMVGLGQDGGDISSWSEIEKGVVSG